MSNPIDSDREIMQLVEAILLQAGDDISNDPSNTRYLRDIQAKLQDFAYRSTDRRLTFVLYFIPLFVNDLHYNLVADIVGVDSGELERVRDVLFSHFGDKLKLIAENLHLGHLDELFAIYTDLVNEYLSTVNELNSKADV